VTREDWLRIRAEKLRGMARDPESEPERFDEWEARTKPTVFEPEDPSSSALTFESGGLTTRVGKLLTGDMEVLQEGQRILLPAEFYRALGAWLLANSR